MYFLLQHGWRRIRSNTGEGEILEKDARYTSLFLLIFLSTKRSEICLRVIFDLKVMKFKSTEIFSVYPCKVFFKLYNLPYYKHPVSKK